MRGQAFEYWSDATGRAPCFSSAAFSSKGVATEHASQPLPSRAVPEHATSASVQDSNRQRGNEVPQRKKFFCRRFVAAKWRRNDRTVVTDTSRLSNDAHRLCTPRKSIASAGTNVRGVVSKMATIDVSSAWDGPLARKDDVRNKCAALPLLISRRKQIKSFTSFFFLFRGLPQDDALNAHLPFELAPVTVWASNFVM